MTKEVTILGRGPSRVLPLPTFGQIWGLNGGYKYCNRLDRIFAMHDESIHTNGVSEACELSEMKELGLEVIDIKSYPIQEIIDEYKVDIFLSTVAYMIALAIYEGYEKINILGVDYVADSYNESKPNTELWIGIAIGKGIEVSINGLSRLCKPDSGFHRFYGYQVDKIEQLQLN